MTKPAFYIISFLLHALPVAPPLVQAIWNITSRWEHGWHRQPPLVCYMCSRATGPEFICETCFRHLKRACVWVCNLNEDNRVDETFALWKLLPRHTSDINYLTASSWRKYLVCLKRPLSIRGAAYWGEESSFTYSGCCLDWWRMYGYINDFIIGLWKWQIELSFYKLFICAE